MFTPDEYYNIVKFTGAGTRRDVVVEEIQQQQQINVCVYYVFIYLFISHSSLSHHSDNQKSEDFRFFPADR